MSRDVAFLLRRDTANDWASKNPILRDGEPGVDTDNGWFKIGDGQTLWNDLPYFVDEEGLAILVQEILTDMGSSDPAIVAHINHPTPHPAYDEGASLTLLYENAKV